MLLLPNSKEITSSSCSCPVLKHFTGLQKNILNSDDNHDMASLGVLGEPETRSKIGRVTSVVGKHCIE